MELTEQWSKFNILLLFVITIDEIRVIVFLFLVTVSLTKYDVMK